MKAATENCMGDCSKYHMRVHNFSESGVLLGQRHVSIGDVKHKVLKEMHLLFITFLVKVVGAKERCNITTCNHQKHIKNHLATRKQTSNTLKYLTKETTSHTKNQKIHRKHKSKYHEKASFVFLKPTSFVGLLLLDLAFANTLLTLGEGEPCTTVSCGNDSI